MVRKAGCVGLLALAVLATACYEPTYALITALDKLDDASDGTKRGETPRDIALQLEDRLEEAAPLLVGMLEATAPLVATAITQTSVDGTRVEYLGPRTDSLDRTVDLDRDGADDAWLLADVTYEREPIGALGPGDAFVLKGVLRGVVDLESTAGGVDVRVVVAEDGVALTGLIGRYPEGEFGPQFEFEFADPEPPRLRLPAIEPSPAIALDTAPPSSFEGRLRVWIHAYGGGLTAELEFEPDSDVVHARSIHTFFGSTSSDLPDRTYTLVR